MPKKCIICGEEAKYSIKGTRDHYCSECAKENFADLSMLVEVEEMAKKVKDLVERRTKAPQEEELNLHEEDKEETESNDESQTQ